MGVFQVRSLVLGIGLGIIITALTSMIYTSGMDTGRSLSDEEIIELAAGLGMVRKEEISGSSIFSKQEKTEGVQSSPDAAENSGVSASSEDIENNTVAVRIVSGDTSEIVAEKLFSAGLIESKADFENRIDAVGRSERISIGVFKIHRGADIDAIIDIITN